MRGNEQFQSANRRRTSLASEIGGVAPRRPIDNCSHRRPFCICFYCICCGARVGLRRILHPFRRVTAHASRNSAHDGEGEGKRGLGMGFHRVNYTISAAGRVGFRGRFPPPRKVSVVRREQIRVLIKTAPLPVHPRCGRPLVGGYSERHPKCRGICRARCLPTHKDELIQ